MNKAEFLASIEGLAGEALFRRVMMTIAQDQVEAYLEFTDGPLAYQVPSLRLWLQDDDDYHGDTLEGMRLLLPGSVTAVIEDT